MRHIISFEHNKKHLILFNGERPVLKIQGKAQTYSNHWKGYIMIYDHTPKCDICGRFFNSKKAGTSWCFVPDSDVSTEENVVRCKPCTDKYGKPLPYQSVVIDRCCGIVTKDEDTETER
jgi:hypothetical protein